MQLPVPIRSVHFNLAAALTQPHLKNPNKQTKEGTWNLCPKSYNLFIDETGSDSNYADQVVNCIVNIYSLIEQAAY